MSVKKRPLLPGYRVQERNKFVTFRSELLTLLLIVAD